VHKDAAHAQLHDAASVLKPCGSGVQPQERCNETRATTIAVAKRHDARAGRDGHPDDVRIISGRADIASTNPGSNANANTGTIADAESNAGAHAWASTGAAA
jgi:hypothetical protein